MSINVRCTNRYCQRRATKPKLLRYYIRAPKCSFCNSPMRVDWYRTAKYEREHNKRTLATCKCGAPHFPHRRGSHEHCQFREEYNEKQISSKIEKILLDKQAPVCSPENAPF